MKVKVGIRIPKPLNNPPYLLTSDVIRYLHRDRDFLGRLASVTRRGLLQIYTADATVSVLADDTLMNIEDHAVTLDLIDSLLVPQPWKLHGKEWFQTFPDGCLYPIEPKKVRILQSFPDPISEAAWAMEAAARVGAVLVTEDRDLLPRARKLSITAVTIEGLGQRVKGLFGPLG